MESTNEFSFPQLTKKQVDTIAHMVAGKIDISIVPDAPILPTDLTKYHQVAYSIYKDTPLLNFLPYSSQDKKVLKGSKSVYSFNLKTLRPTLNSKLKYDLPEKTKERLKKIISP
jgi:hypothetical protein